MSHKIRSCLEEYIRQEQALFDRLLQLKRWQVDVRKEITKAVISEVAVSSARDLFDSSRAGRLGQKMLFFNDIRNLALALHRSVKYYLIIWRD